MKKTITLAALALTASASYGLIMKDPSPREYKTICMDTYESADGSKVVETCDQSRNNETSQVSIMENGCAEGQIALNTSRRVGERTYDIEIHPCLPVNVAQL